MGLGLWLTAPKEDVARRSMKKLQEAIGRFVADDPGDPLLQRVIRCSPEGGRLFVQLHPAEEGAEFFLSKDGELVCSAKTSTAGPGYHAFLVDWLDRLGRALEVQWRGRQDQAEGDDTGYFAHRDFGRLQAAMAEWLGTLARIVLEKDDCTGFMLGLPVKYLMETGGWYAASPMGFWDRAFFRRARTASRDEALKLASAYFPWWNQGLDATFWSRLGTVLMWVEVPWHVPLESERATVQVALGSFERARAMSGTVELPELEIVELRRLLEGHPPARPGESRIGFRRRRWSMELSGGWTMKLPSYFYSDLEDDGRTQVFWHDSRTVRASSLTLERKDGKVESPKGMLRESKVPPEAIRREEKQLCGWASLSPEEENGRNYWALHGEAAAPNNLCVVTICFDDEADREWAISAWRSLAWRSGGATGGSGD